MKKAAFLHTVMSVFSSITQPSTQCSELSSLQQMLNVQTTIVIIMYPTNVLHFQHVVSLSVSLNRGLFLRWNLLKSAAFSPLWSWREPSCLPVAGCEHVRHLLVCNLTQAFSDPRQVYLTQVTAMLEARASQSVPYPGFQPMRDSKWLCVETRT